MPTGCFFATVVTGGDRVAKFLFNSGVASQNIMFYPMGRGVFRNAKWRTCIHFISLTHGRFVSYRRRGSYQGCGIYRYLRAIPNSRGCFLWIKPPFGLLDVRNY